MPRKLKNIIQVTILIILIGLTVGTVYLASENKTTNHFKDKEFNMRGTPPNMNNGNGGPPDMNNSKHPPREKPDNDFKETPPNMNNDNNSNDENNNNESNIQNNTTNNNNSNDTTNNRMTPPDMGHHNGKSKVTLPYLIGFISEGLLIGLLVMYLIMSEFNKKTFKETIKSTDKILIIVLGFIVISGGLTSIDSFVSNNLLNNTKDTNINERMPSINNNQNNNDNTTTNETETNNNDNI